MQNFSTFGLKMTKFEPLEPLWIRPKVFPLAYWKLTEIYHWYVEETHMEP